MVRLQFDIPDYASYLDGDLYSGFDSGVRRQIALSLANDHIRFVETEAKAKAPSESGRLKASIRARLLSDRLGVLEATAPYAKYLHHGTGVYGPRRKHIVIDPKEKKALNWSGAKHPVRRVRQQGIKPNDFLRMAIHQKRVEDRMRLIMKTLVMSPPEDSNSWYKFWNWGEFNEDLLHRAADFSAGFGDTFTFGGTSAIRRLMGTDKYVNKSSWTYKLGVYSETAFEIISMGGSALLRHLAKRASRKAVYNASYKMTKSIPRNGKFLHHKDPLFGHPSQITRDKAVFPTGGLPAKVHSHSWNLKLLTYDEHMKAHRWLYRLERFSKYFVNPKVSTARAINAYLLD